MSIRFPDFIRRDMLVREIRTRFPQTREVFERYGVRPACWDSCVTQVTRRRVGRHRRPAAGFA